MQLSHETNRDNPQWVKVANGSYMEVAGQVSITLVLGRYRTRIRARILEIPDYDIILRFEWLQQVNPVID